MLPALFLAAATAAPPKPLRHMEFSFHFSGTGETISHYSGIGTTDPGVATMFTTGGYDGKIYVDVMSLGPNDSLLLNIRQEVPLAHSVDVPTAQLLTYPTGQVDLPPNSIPLSEPELNLARFLGRKFINGDYLDEKNHWHIDMKPPGGVSVATDFTINKNTDGILDITEDQKVTAQMSNTRTRGTISYDMNRTVPLSIREEKIGDGVDLRLEYTLTADSLAPAKP
jgi:hypothetical protein